MRRLLTCLCPGLLLVCCDKPDKHETHMGATVPGTRVTHDRHSLRERISETPAATVGIVPDEHPSDSPAALRSALQAAMDIESPADRGKALAEVAWNALDIDPELASEAFLQLPKGSDEKLRLIQHYAMRLAEQDPDEAIEWAAGLGFEQEIAAAMGRIALVLAETDPHRAANLLSESGIAGREFDVTAVEVLQRWAAQSPLDAAAWAVLFPPGAAREAGMTMIFERWLPRDAPAAFDWFSSLQDERLRKETARAMEGVILQQPQAIRDAWLQYADAPIRSEIAMQREQAIMDVGNNIPPSAN